MDSTSQPGQLADEGIPVSVVNILHMTQRLCSFSAAKDNLVPKLDAEIDIEVDKFPAILLAKITGNLSRSISSWAVAEGMLDA